jgi:iron complex outermembrane receptor protein
MLLLLKIAGRLHFIFFTLCSAACFAQDGIIKGIVKDQETVLESATISIANKIFLTNAKGEFSVTLKPGTYMIVVTYVGYKQNRTGLFTLNAGETKLFEFNMVRKEGLDDVVVLRSRSFVQRSNLNTAVPVDLISSGQLKQTGQLSLMQMLSFSSTFFQHFTTEFI